MITVPKYPKAGDWQGMARGRRERRQGQTGVRIHCNQSLTPPGMARQEMPHSSRVSQGKCLVFQQCIPAGVRLWTDVEIDGELVTRVSLRSILLVTSIPSSPGYRVAGCSFEVLSCQTSVSSMHSFRNTLSKAGHHLPFPLSEG